ncbi:MAG TPA: GWxTD domain-containing protein [Candidatus Polarisedimenticolia bacterium]|jgi:GWxTD domain-containing protein
MRHAFAPARPILFLSLVALLSPARVFAAAAADSWDVPDAKWRSGPVKLLLTREEDQAYKKLKTDEERASFVEAFWARRDPSPDSPGNEYREAFYRLSREAAARFTDEGGKGWQDDRGKVFILLGPPDDIQQEAGLIGSDATSSSGFDSPAATAGGGTAAEARPQTPTKRLKFIYFKNPLSGKNDRLELDFRSDMTGGYTLEQKLDWNHPFLKGLARLPKPAAAAKEGAGGVGAGASPSPAAPAPRPVPAEALAPPAPPPVEVTPQSELMQSVRTATDLQATVPLDVTTNFYKASSGTFATLTLEVKRSALPAGVDPASLVLAAEILDLQTGESLHRFFKADSFGAYDGNTGPAAGDVLLYQSERPINPGKYKTIFAVKDPNSHAIGKLEKEIEVPSFESGSFQLSTVTLARKIEPLVTAPPADKLVPFVLGAFNVVPRPDNVYKEGEELSFYFQIYGPTIDPVTNAARVDLSYTFEKNVAGQWRVVSGRPVLTPGQSGLVQAFSLPLRGWPPGEYRLSIKVTDTKASPPKEVTSVVPFSIAGAPGAAKSKTKSKG